ncbi:prepilin peptidase [archaeon]|nr:prepilin peptidase [archaeon]
MLAIRFFLALAMLGLAAYSDLKSREVEDRLWLAFAFLGFLAAAIEIGFNAGGWIYFTANAGLAFVLMEALIYLGERQPMLFIGPADLKAVMVLSILNWDSLGFALIVFVLALVISLVHAVKAVVLNLKEKPGLPAGLKGIALFLTSYQKRISLLGPFESPMQEIKVKRKSGRWIALRRWRLMPLIEPLKENLRLKELVERKKIADRVQAGELPAFMLYLLISFILLFILLQLPFMAGSW